MVKNLWTKDARAPQPEEALDFILFEHLKHREMCNALDQVADAVPLDLGLATALADFIRSDLTLHIADEEELFFPMLLERCMPEDQVGPALERLNAEHARDRDLSAEVRITLLKAVTESLPPSRIPGGAEALHTFAQSQRRHMMLENAVLIPLARRRLKDEDWRVLGQRFAKRHRAGPSLPA